MERRGMNGKKKTLPHTRAKICLCRRRESEAVMDTRDCRVGVVVSVYCVCGEPSYLSLGGIIL